MSTTNMNQVLKGKLSRRNLLGVVGAGAAGSLLLACSGNKESPSTTTEGTTAVSQNGEVVGWTEASHSNKAAPDYDVVFPSDHVNALTLRISPDNWQKMLDDMTALLGARGSTGANQAAGQPPFGGQFPEGQQPPAGGMRPEGEAGAFGGGGPGGRGGSDITPTNPIWVPGTVEFEGKAWAYVGIRFKGNSSLSGAWRGGTDSLPFKLDFDEFEDTYAEIKNQRFYGFKQLSLSNNTGDAAYMRDTIAFDLLRDAGLVGARSAATEIVLDHGEGPTSLGIYTAIEVIDDTVVARSFKDATGNIYEADGRAASLAAGVDSQIPTSFQVESDATKADWSDIKALYTALHSSDRTSNPASWRKNLEAVFDVDVFLEWLGISAVLQHWDTYGGMTHNYYLYNNPETKKLTWISWDHNFILGASMGGGGGMGGANAGFPPAGFPDPADLPGGQAAPGGGAMRGGGMGGPGSTSLDKKDVTASWPLIRYLMDDSTYYAAYIRYLRENATKIFNVSTLRKKYEALASVIEPRTGSAATTYDSNVSSLMTTLEQRVTALNEFLTQQA